MSKTSRSLQRNKASHPLQRVVFDIKQKPNRIGGLVAKARKHHAAAAKKPKAEKPGFAKTASDARSALPKILSKLKAGGKKARLQPVKKEKPSSLSGFSALEREAINVAKLIRMGANAIIPANDSGEKLLKDAKYVRTETPAGAVYYRPDVAKRMK